MVCISDCARDEVAAKGAGIGCMTIGSFSTEDLIDRVCSNPAPEPDTRDYDSFRVPVMGIIGCIAGDTLGSRYEHHPTTDSDFPLFPSGSHPTDDSLGTLAVARWLLGDRTRVMFSTVTRFQMSITILNSMTNIRKIRKDAVNLAVNNTRSNLF